MKFSILLTLALTYTTLSSAQNFRRDNADKAEQLQNEFAKLTKDSPCENDAQACVEDQFAQCVNGKFQLNSCGGGELKCVALPLVNKPGTSITCSTEADRLARLADARGEPPPGQGKDVKAPKEDAPKEDAPKEDDGKLPPNKGDGKDGNAPPNKGDGKDGNAPPNKGDGKDGNAPPNKGDGKDGNAPPNKGDGKDGNAPPELGKGRNEKLPSDNLCKCPGDGNNNDDIDNGNDGNNGGDNGNNGDDENNGDDANNGDDGNNGDGKDGNVPNNQDKVQAPPANGDDLRKQNVAEAKALQEKFDKLKPDDDCTDNEVACVENKFAQCSGGKFALTDCASGTVCAALPLVLKKGTTVACTTEADRDARLKQASK